MHVIRHAHFRQCRSGYFFQCFAWTTCGVMWWQRNGCSKNTALVWHPPLGLLSIYSLQWRHNQRDGVSNHHVMMVYLTVSSSTDQKKHQSSASSAFVWGIHGWLENSLHKGSITRKSFPFDDVIMLDVLAPEVWSHNALLLKHWPLRYVVVILESMYNLRTHVMV